MSRSFLTSCYCLGGGINSFFSASRRARIFIKTVVVRVAASSWSGVDAGVFGTGVCVDLPSSKPVFLFGQGVGEGSTQVVG